jgi:hypothetical protein
MKKKPNQKRKLALSKKTVTHLNRYSEHLGGMIPLPPTSDACPETENNKYTCKTNALCNQAPTTSKAVETTCNRRTIPG